MWTTTLTAVSLIGSGIQAGALLLVMYGVCPTFRTLEVPEWMRLHVSLDRSVERYMPALNITTGGTTLVLLFLPQPGLARAVWVAALLCNISLALMSELVNVRINKFVSRQVAVAAGAPVPAARGGAAEPAAAPVTESELMALRERWIGWHGWRTATIVLGFVLYVVAAVAVRS